MCCILTYLGPLCVIASIISLLLVCICVCLTILISIIKNICICDFVDSENYIFGKFDTFVKRITKIADMISTMEAFAGLEDARIEGLETVVIQYKNLVDMAKKKNYDILDHRKQQVRKSFGWYLASMCDD